MHAISGPETVVARSSEVGASLSGLSGMLPTAVWLRIASDLRLSPRELEIALCMLDGLSSIKTAKRLGISENTLHSHRTRIYHKLNVRNQAGVVAKFFKAYVPLATTQSAG